MGRVGAGVVWRRVGALVAARRWRGRVLLSSTQGTHKGPHSTQLYPCPYAIPGQVRSAEQHTYLSELEVTSESLHFSAYVLILKTCEELPVIHLAPEYIYTPAGLQANMLVSITDQGLISSIGPRDALWTQSVAPIAVETLPGLALPPGFVNVHSHVFQCALRGH